MPRVSIISLLSEELRRDIDERLRNSGYGDLVAICQWLSETHGVKISKTSMGVYSKDRKTKDRAADLMTVDVRGGLADRQAIDLLAELGALRIREHRIINRLEEIGFIGKGCFDKRSKSQSLI
ncbi:DUF3486 family protein [Pseudomonas proteolytica]|nr:DUF3486 family protein [Pseudomonas proteolytica]